MRSRVLHCALGEQIPALARWAEVERPPEFAARVAADLKLPTGAPVLSERTMRRYWSDRA
jgi:hypothetical protein